MGFLIFAARKLQLKRQINDLQFRNMQLSNEQQSITVQIANAQKAQNAAKNTVNYMTTVANSVSVFNQSIQQKNAYSAFEDAKAKGQEISFDDFAKQNNINGLGTSAVSTAANVAGNVMNSIFDATNQVQLARLSAKDSQIGLEMDNNESQLSLISAEYQNVKKAESEEARNSAPTFGLA